MSEFERGIAEQCRKDAEAAEKALAEVREECARVAADFPLLSDAVRGSIATAIRNLPLPTREERR